MSRDEKLYLRDIRDAIQKIRSFTDNVDKERFTTDELIGDGTLFNLIVIGEAAKNIPDRIRELDPDIEWQTIGRFRDLTVHHYWGLQMDKVWDIVQTDIPELEVQVLTLLEMLDSENPSE